jgi:hypothetical protein
MVVTWQPSTIWPVAGWMDALGGQEQAGAGLSKNKFLSFVYVINLKNGFYEHFGSATGISCQYIDF